MTKCYNSQSVLRAKAKTEGKFHVMNNMTVYRNILTIAVVMITASAVGQNTDTGTSSGSAFKIGVVDQKAVFTKYDKQAALYSDLEKTKDGLQKELDELSETIEAAKTRYTEEGSSLTDDERKKLKEQIDSDFDNYKFKTNRSQKEIDMKEMDLVKELRQEIREAIETIGLKENYHLILEGDPESRSGVLYYQTRLNMTEKVVGFLNEKYAKEKANPAN